MSDLKDFQGTVFNSAKTVVTKTLGFPQRTTSGNVTGDIGLELTDIEHTISSDVQSVIMMGTLNATGPSGACWHILRCWRNEVPVYAGGSGRAASFIDTLVGSCVIGTDHPGFNNQSANFVFVDNNIGDSTQQRYRWTIWTSNSSDSRELEVRYLTNPMWDLRNT